MNKPYLLGECQQICLCLQSSWLPSKGKLLSRAERRGDKVCHYREDPAVTSVLANSSIQMKSSFYERLPRTQQSRTDGKGSCWPALFVSPPLEFSDNFPRRRRAIITLSAGNKSAAAASRIRLWCCTVESRGSPGCRSSGGFSPISVVLEVPSPVTLPLTRGSLVAN